MKKVVIDTSIIIDYTRAGIGPFFELHKSSDVYIPTIVIVELWAGKSMNDKTERLMALKLIKNINRVELTEKIAQKTGELLRTHQMASSPDAIVAATALELDAYLATSNQKHFTKVKGLRLYT